MTTWLEFKTNVRRAVQDDIVDANGDFQVPDEQLLAYFTYAQNWAAARHASLSRATVTIDSTTYIGTVPGDVYRITGVFTDENELLEVDSFRLKPDEWSLITDTEIKIGDTDADEVEILYLGSYDTIAGNDGDVIPGPVWLEEALFNYTVSRMLSHLAVGSGDLSQFDTNTDSGHPEHNPLLRLAQHYEDMAERSLNKRQIR